MWMGSTHCAFLWQSSSWPGSRWGWGAPHLLLAGAWAAVQSRSVGVKELSLGSPSGWDHQLGLALRSRWDIEIPDCP